MTRSEIEKNIESHLILADIYHEAAEVELVKANIGLSRLESYLDDEDKVNDLVEFCNTGRYPE
jgi:hypothetical protein